MSDPQKLGRYHVVGHLAAGGMAEILLGKMLGPSGFERPVVIKRILPHFATKPAFVDMFLDEARVVARIQHPNVVNVHELGQDGDDLFLVMEYLEGESVLSLLRRATRRSERLDRWLGAYIVSRACAGLHAAHELRGDAGEPLGLVHRDVSPSNIFVTYSGAVKLLDFGIAKFEQRTTDTEAGGLKGKFPYMSPEQCHAQPLDRRSDIFSLGTVLWEAITNRRLFARDSSLASMKAITEEEIPSPAEADADCPPELAAICMRALQRVPDERYSTAAEMQRDLVNAFRNHLGAIPEESLAAVMKDYFPERLEQKRELLRRVKSGSQITNVPMPDVDVSVEIPTAFTSGVGQSTPFAVEAQPLVRARPKRKGIAIALLVLAVALGVGLIGVMALSGPSEGETSVAASTREPVEPAASSRAVEPGVEMAAEPETETEPALDPDAESEQEADRVSANVELSLLATPNARVRIDGEAHGETPLTVAIPRGNTSVEIVFSRPGHRPETRLWIPNEATELEVTLSPHRSRTMRAGSMGMPPASGMTEMSGSPFRRFN